MAQPGKKQNSKTSSRRDKAVLPRVRCVIFGEPKIQLAKVRSLGLDNHPLIERILYADRDKLLTKEAAFRQIQQLVELAADEMLVVGDRPMSEIRAGNELGMHTVRVHRGEFVVQQPQNEREEPDYVVRDISEVKKLPICWMSNIPSAARDPYSNDAE